ncbi:fimbrial protein [Haemophilus influenzae]|uniref:fimbrial protein n=2 Tax=Haemophilus influenzae TaxID=727 RepID=UPI000D491C9D|nr:Major fimbrial subunit precursor [Haemophilus influenzae]
MKKTLLGSLILLAFAGNVQAAHNGGDDPETAGRVTFFGKVVENTCKVKTKNRDMSVVLHDVGKNSLSTEGNTAMPTPFTITLQNCQGATQSDKHAKKVGLYFYSWENADKDKNYTLKNMEGTDKATNVNIQLMEEDGTTSIKVVGKDTEDFTYPKNGVALDQNAIVNPTSGSVTLNSDADIPLHFIAQYYATGKATAGKVQTSVNFEIAYE